MNDCLITKLKGSVDSDEMPYFDSIEFKVKSTTSEDFINDSFCVQLKTNGNISIKATGEGKIATSFSDIQNNNGVTNLDIDDTEENYTSVYFSNNNFIAIVNGASNIVGIKRPSYSSVSRIAISITTAMPSLSELSFYNLASGHHNSLELIYLKDSPLQTFIFKDSKEGSIKNSTDSTNLTKQVIGDFSILSQKNIQELDLVGVQPDKALISGDTASLVQSSLNLLKVRYTTLTYSPVEDYVNAYKDSGLNTSSNKGIYCQYLLAFTKFLDNAYKNTSLYQKLFWDEHKYGVAVGASPNSNWNTASTIYVHGATQEEIEAWEDANKTVIVVNEPE